MRKEKIRFELIVDVDMGEIDDFCKDTQMSEADAIKQINNTIYLGLSCIDGMLYRQFEIENVDSFVHSVTDGNDNEVI